MVNLPLYQLFRTCCWQQIQGKHIFIICLGFNISQVFVLFSVKCGFIWLANYHILFWFILFILYHFPNFFGNGFVFVRSCNISYQSSVIFILHIHTTHELKWVNNEILFNLKQWDSNLSCSPSYVCIGWDTCLVIHVHICRSKLSELWVLPSLPGFRKLLKMMETWNCLPGCMHCSNFRSQLFELPHWFGAEVVSFSLNTQQPQLQSLDRTEYKI